MPESVCVLGEWGNNAYTRGVITLNSFMGCPLHPASQGVSLYCLSCKHMGMRVSYMVHGANSHSVSVEVTYRLVGMEEMPGSHMQLYRSQGKSIPSINTV